MLIEDTIRLFLDSIGRSEEYEFYLKKFLSDRSSCFALLCPDEGALTDGGENLRFALAFLRRLELLPAVLFTGPRAEELFAHLGAAEETVVYRPFESTEMEDDVPRRMPRRSLAEADSAGAALEVELLCELSAAIMEARSRGRSLAIVCENETLLSALQFLTRQVAPRAYFIRNAGALRDPDGRELLYYHFRSGREKLHPEDGGLAHLTQALLEYAAERRRHGEKRNYLHLSVTAPFNLLKEIFTVKGAGTIVRPGSVLLHLTNAADVDRERLVELLGQSFRKKLVNQNFLEHAAHVYVEENYQGAIILEEQPMGLYLSKFAVDKQARGLGIAQELWEEVIHKHPALFWRSRTSNSINRWYASLADGMHRVAPWNIFWRGVNPADIPQIVEFCTQRPEDFAAM